MFAPTAPLGKAASSSCVNLAIVASIFAAETWPFIRCLAASSGTQGAKATTMATAAAICVRSLVQSFLR
jgi:hypothetical protein